jgi:hypothetical protein
VQKKRKPYYLIPFLIIAIAAILSGIVMLLWNEVLTEIVNVKKITFWQALGLFILCKILFSSFRPGPPGGFRKHGPPWRQKLMDMTDEEREAFKREWQKRNADKNAP